MTHSWLSNKQSFLRAVAAAMGCLFGCFRFKDSSSSTAAAASAPHLPPSTTDVSAKKGNSLSSLLLSGEEDLIDSPVKDKKTFPEADFDPQELKDEASFLKACGTLAETPNEIRNFSKDESSENGESEFPKFRSWLVDMPVEKLNLENQLNQSEQETEITVSFDHTPSSCMTGGQSFRRVSTSSVEAHEIQDNVGPSVQGRNRTVRFECESSISSGSFSSGNRNEASVTKASPYPTPLKLSEEMQTPGTVFPSYQNNKIRSQYVYSVNQPIEQVVGKEMGSTSVTKGEASLADWLKPPPPPLPLQEGISPENVNSGGTPGDRPILGMVAAHWKDEEPSRISPKWWDGNGIPNSTNKYKEDQKVNWHATPFEERLEKALSDETFISQRKQISDTEPIAFKENEELDTALSKFQSSSANFKSVVSC